MTRATLISYMEQYAAGTLGPEEEKVFLAWLETVSPGEFQEILDASGVPGDFKAWRLPSAANVRNFRQRLAEREQPVVRRMFPWPRIAAAAAVLLLAGGAVWFMQTRIPEAQQPPAQAAWRPPGGNKAVLTLADGSVIELDDAKDGTLSRQGGASIIKLPGGKIAYDHGGAPGEQVYNTISTPKGGQYQVQLSDGTVVSLNAASSLRFPAVFNGSERVVELKGEGYFDVAALAGSPFRVEVRDARVEVLGTQFNINAYPDEPVAQTTLLRGAVKVVRGTETMLLRPGQQANFRDGEKMALQAADVEQAVAWKNGFFHFEGTSLPVLMRQIGRWYNVEVAFRGEVPDRQFAGRITRDVGLQAVVDALKSSGVNCRMQGNVLEVFP